MPTPIKCFDGNAQPHEPFWQWKNLESETPEMEIEGVLSQYSWLDDEITPQMFKDDLYKYGKGGPVLMKINSPGGDVIAAAKMRDIMKEYPGEITVRVSGMAASAAVMVAISGKRVQISDASYMMIHDPMVVVLGMLDIETLGRLQENLKSIKAGIVPAYAQKTGMSEGVISNMMTKETWMSAQEAVAKGFADEIWQGAPQKVQAGYVNILQNYGNVPQGVLDLTSKDEPPVDVERERNLERLRERVETLRKGEEA